MHVDGEFLHYYQVYFNNPLSLPFTYSSPHTGLIHKRVKVELRKRIVIGFVDAQIEKSDIPKDIEIKSIQEVIDETPIIDREQRNLAAWISKQYLSSLGEALGLFFSFKAPKPKTTIQEAKKKNGEEGRSTAYRDDRLGIELSSSQKEQFVKIEDRLRGLRGLRGFHPFLIHGVTGSGKTFFYLKIAEACLTQGQQVLILVPEITLIFQIYDLVERVFPQATIGMYHSKMGEGAREKIRSQVRLGKIDLIISTRSGFFLPFQNLKLIVMDEEHENSYKNNATPRYQLKQVAYHWAKMKEIPLVFVSATPTLDIFHQTQGGDISEVELTERYAEAHLPELTFMVREEEEEISEGVYQQVFNTLEGGQQVLFYINQRGFSSTVICADCRHDYFCPHCQITLTFHKKKNSLICHYCGFAEPFPQACRECGGASFRFIKAGTENFWEQLQKRFARYRVVKFDSDSITRPKQIIETLKDFKEQRIHILVGTQMIIKGHDFKNVGLVVVLAPEKYLLLPDYRSGERMFSQIMQVAGRAGRERRLGLGKVIVETDIPHHYALQAAKKQSYLEFYHQEIQYRKKFDYPPFCKLIRIVYRGLDHRQVEQAAYLGKEEILKKFGKTVVLLGPSPCLLEKQNRYYRWNILLKVKQQNYFLENIQKTRLIKNPNVYMEIDVSPVDLF